MARSEVDGPAFCISRLCKGIIYSPPLSMVTPEAILLVKGLRAIPRRTTQ